MEEALELVRSKDTKVRMAGVERLHQFLKASTKPLSSSEATSLVDTCLDLLKDDNFPVSQGALQALASAAVLAGDHFKIHLSTLFPASVERLGDAEQPVRDSARRLLLTLTEIFSPSIIVERAGSYAWEHKNWRIREEFARAVTSSINQFASSELPLLRAILPPILQMLNDLNYNVREAATCCIEEMYTKMGRQLLEELQRHQLPSNMGSLDANKHARRAYRLFQSRDYSGCLEILMGLSNDNPKVLHNIAVTKFVQDGHSDWKKLFQDLDIVEQKFHKLDVVTLNKAIILYHLHDYPKAMSVLEPIFQKINHIDEGTTFHVCHLLLDLAVATHDALKLDVVLNYVKSKGHKPSNSTTKSSNHPSSSLIDLECKLPLYDYHVSLLTRSLKMEAEQLLRTQFELAQGNYLEVKKLLNTPSNQLGAKRSILELEKLLNTSSILYNNNVGCMYYQLRKYNTAGIFIRKALNGCITLRKEGTRNLATLSRDEVLISYNSGLQYLAGGDPVLAVQCFQKSSIAFYNRPLLWLRLAECSMMALAKGVSKTFDQLLLEQQFNVDVLGQGKWWLLAAQEDNTRNKDARSKAKEAFSPSKDGTPNPSLSFAKYCLSKALTLVDHHLAGLTLKTTPEDSESTVVASSSSSKGSKKCVAGAAKASSSLYADTYRRESLHIKQAILAAQVFVELELGHPRGALSRADALLNMPECTKVNAFLGRIYAAEALCLLNKPEEAAEYLSVYAVNEEKIGIPYSEDYCEEWQVNKPLDSEKLAAKSKRSKKNKKIQPAKAMVTEKPPAEVGSVIPFCKPEEAQGAICVNLASMSAVKGDLDKATFYATQALSLIPNSPDANLMVVYLDLKLGKVNEVRKALAKLQSCKNCVPYGSKSLTLL